MNEMMNTNNESNEKESSLDSNEIVVKVADKSAYEPYKGIIDALLDKHAESVEFFDVRDISGFADAFIIATARSEPNARTLREAAMDALDVMGVPYKVEGEKSVRWCLVDAGHVIVHIFNRDGKYFYSLEKLWGNAPMICFENEDI